MGGDRQRREKERQTDRQRGVGRREGGGEIGRPLLTIDTQLPCSFIAQLMEREQLDEDIGQMKELLSKNCRPVDEPLQTYCSEFNDRYLKKNTISAIILHYL